MANMLGVAVAVVLTVDELVFTHRVWSTKVLVTVRTRVPLGAQVTAHVTQAGNPCTERLLTVPAGEAAVTLDAVFVIG